MAGGDVYAAFTIDAANATMALQPAYAGIFN